MPPKKNSDPERGDLVEVHWADICEAIGDHPDKAALAPRTSYGIFWERKVDDGIPVVVTTTTIDKDGPENAGWCCYLEACITKMIVLRKARKQKTKRTKADKHDKPDESKPVA